MASTDPWQVRPSPALVRALLATLAGTVPGILLHRLDLVVAVTPLVVWLGWAALTREHLRKDPAAPVWQLPVRLEPMNLLLHEGDRARLHLTAPEGVIVGATIRPPEGSRLRPACGALVGSQDELSFEVEPDSWGRVLVGPVHVGMTEASGAWQREFDTTQATIAVQPAATSLLAPSGVAHPLGISGLHHSVRRGPGTDLAGVREYVPGDRLQRINWRVSSRSRTLHTNETFTERDTDVLLVLDTLLDLAPPASATEPASSGSSLDATTRAAGAITQHYVALGDRVAVRDLGTRIGDLRPGTGQRQMLLLLTLLSQARRDAPPLASLRAGAPVTPGTLVFFCSPLLDDRVLAELHRLHRQGADVVVVDTFPGGLGTSRLPGPEPEHMSEAWMLRRLERDETVAGLRAMGIPLAPWEGPASLAGVLRAMELSRTAPSLHRGRR